MTSFAFLADYPLLAALASALAAFALGLFWYHPNVLGARWLEARGLAGAQVSRPSVFQIGVTLFLWLVAACFYGFLVMLLNITTLPTLLCLSCLLWVAYAMPPIVMGSLYTGYPFQAAAIDAAYQLGGYYLFALMFMILS